MDKSVGLNDSEPRKAQIIVNRIHSLTHGAALLALFYYRITSISAIPQNTPILPHLLIFISELTFSFLWLLCQASNWRPVTRTVYPERLPGDEALPAIDVFVCTADPDKEPSLEVMNTVISAMALDYPPQKLHVYLSDDGGSPVTLRAVKLAWSFANLWVPFCRKYAVKNRLPEGYFLSEEVGGSDEFLVERKEMERGYEDLKRCLSMNFAGRDAGVSKDHPPIIQVISDDPSHDERELPLLVYVAREKRPSHHHNFKAGALNVLLRVSAMMSNSPYILNLDCDMYCNNPTSARQAMCFHLDPRLSPNLAFVQFPQRFHNVRRNDIYDDNLRFLWRRWEGLDGLRGPILSGTGFYIKREALYGTSNFQQGKCDELINKKKWFGSSNEFIKSIYRNNKTNYPTDDPTDDHDLQKEVQLLASCSYEDGSKWGEEVGYRYFALIEDCFTGFNLHCEGWTSVYFEPSRPCFLGSSPITLGETLVQNTRWFIGTTQIALSKYSPLVYGSLRMSILQSMIYAELTYYAIYFLPLYILAIVPQLCLLRDIPLYPEVSSPFFLVFSFLFVSSQLKHVYEVLTSGYPIKTWTNEERIWMMKSFTCFLFASLNSTMEKIGLTKVSFVPTNKVVDDEAADLYEMGRYDFRAPAAFMVPLCSLYILNLASLVVGFGRSLQNEKINEMLMQAFVPLFGVVLNLPLLEGMLLRKDKGRVPSSVSLVSAVISSIVLAYYY